MNHISTDIYKNNLDHLLKITEHIREKDYLCIQNLKLMKQIFSINPNEVRNLAREYIRQGVTSRAIHCF